MERPSRSHRHLNVRKLVGYAGVAFLTVVVPTSLAAQPESSPPPPLPPDVLAQQPRQPPPNLPNPAELREELSMLYEFLSASPEKLARMRQKIEMIEKMSVENREFLRLRLVQLQADAPELQSEIETLAKDLSPSQRTAAVHYWLSLRPKEREAEREKMAAMEADERSRHLQLQAEEFRKAQEELRSRLLDATEGPPNFVPPPPPVFSK